VLYSSLTRLYDWCQLLWIFIYNVCNGRQRPLHTLSASAIIASVAIAYMTEILTVHTRHRHSSIGCTYGRQGECNTVYITATASMKTANRHICMILVKYWVFQYCSLSAFMEIAVVFNIGRYFARVRLRIMKMCIVVYKLQC